MSGIIDILTNPLMLILETGSGMLMLGLFLGVYMSQPRKNKVIQFSPESGRGIEYNVDKEDEINIKCDSVLNTPPQKFMKYPLQTGYNIVKKGIFKRLHNYALWIGRMGTAYTFPLDTNRSLTLEQIEKTTLKQTLQNILEPENYDKLGSTFQKKIEEAQVGVLIQFPKVDLTPPGMPSMSSDDIHRHAIEEFIGMLAQGIKDLMKKSGSREVINTIITLIAGCTFGLLIAWFLHIGSTTVVQQAPAKFIVELMR